MEMDTYPKHAYFVESEEIIKKYGYEYESHEVQTDDGYFLTMDRIKGKLNENNQIRKPAVFLMHGLTGFSGNFLTNGVKSLAYVLSDEGYDVWLGNSRGSRYSKKHKTLQPKDKAFWDFSWHEIGIYDLPAFIDYILMTTNQSQLNYIGHSQGTTAFYVLMSERPEYNQKIIVHNSLSPVIFMNNTKSPIFQFLGKFWWLVEFITNIIGIYELDPEPIFTPWIVSKIFTTKTFTFNLLALIINYGVGLNKKQSTPAQVPIAASQMTSTSKRQFIHYGQIVGSGEFQKYDYGPIKNLRLYGKKSPPAYKTENISCPIILHYADCDKVTVPEDVERAMKLLSNLVSVNKIEDFHHLDFICAKSSEHLVNDKVLEVLKKYNSVI